MQISIFWPDFTVFIVSDLNDLTFMYTNTFLFYSYTVTISAHLVNTYNEIFKYCYTEHYHIIMFIFAMRTVLPFYKTLLLFNIFFLSMVYACGSQFANQKCWSDLFYLLTLITATFFVTLWWNRYILAAHNSK